MKLTNEQKKRLIIDGVIDGVIFVVSAIVLKKIYDHKKIKKKIPKSCSKCDYCRIDDSFGLYCSVVESWLPECYDNRPPFCPYEIAKKELNRCSNC